MYIKTNRERIRDDEKNRTRSSNGEQNVVARGFSQVEKFPPRRRNRRCSRLPNIFYTPRETRDETVRQRLEKGRQGNEWKAQSTYEYIVMAFHIHFHTQVHIHDVCTRVFVNTEWIQERGTQKRHLRVYCVYEEICTCRYLWIYAYVYMNIAASSDWHCSAQFEDGVKLSASIYICMSTEGTMYSNWERSKRAIREYIWGNKK